MKKRIAIIVVSILGTLVVGVFAGEMWLRHTVRVAVGRALGSAGTEFTLGRVSVSLPLRQVSVRDVTIRTHGDDTSPGGSALVSVEFAVPHLILRGIGWSRAGERPLITASRLTVHSPRATLVTRSGGGDANGGFIDTLSMPSSSSPTETIHSRAAIRIDDIAVSGASRELVHWSANGDHTRLVLGGADATATGATLDSLPATLGLRADSLFFAPAGGATILRADTLSLDATAGTVSLAALSLIPQFDKARFAERSPGHRDWTSIRLGAIACLGVDFASLLSATPAIAIDSISLRSAAIASYKNRHIHGPASTKLLLHETIQHLPLPIDIRTLSFADLDIAYEELAERADSPGTVTVTDIHGHAANITNIATPGRDPHTTIDILSATLMQSGTIRARFRLPVDPADDRWELTGSLGPTDMRAFNPVIEPLMNARLTSGAIRSLDFALVATSVRSHTSLTMSYENLRVEFLHRHDHTRQRRFLTAIADDILIRPDNPGRNGRGRLRTTEAGATHDTERSMWNYIWRSLEGAILKTVI